MKNQSDRLPLPVHRLLDDALDEAALMRTYRAVEARRTKPRPRRNAVLLAAAAVMVAFAVFLWWRHPAAGPIALASGAPLTSVSADAGAITLVLDDASTITLERGAHLSPLENGPDRVALVIDRGRAHFEVTPGGKRRWSIETGLATVDVVGTGFTIDRDETRVRVEVTHGIVLVRGDSVEDRVKRLEKGDAIEIVDPRLRQTASSTVTAPAPVIPSAAPPLPSASQAAGAPAWRAMASRGDYREAYALLGEGGIRDRAQGASVDELFLLADVARLSGHGGEALVPLAKIVEAHPTDARAPLAAFTLGKLYQGQNPAAAAHAFERAIGMGLSASLRGDAASRWLEACVKLGDADCEARARRSAGLPAPASSGAASP